MEKQFEKLPKSGDEKPKEAGVNTDISFSPKDKKELNFLMAQASKAETTADKTALLEKYQEKLKEIKAEIEKRKIIGKTPDGKEVRFEISEQLEYWRDFYKEQGIDWVDLPESIELTEEQKREIKRLIEEVGLDKMIIIPEGLADTGDKYEKLHDEMSKGYSKSFQGGCFKDDGRFKGIENKNNGLRIVIVKDIQNLEDDELHNETKGKSVDNLEAEDGIFAEKGLRGLDLATYLVLHREYYKQTGKYLEKKGGTLLPEVGRPAFGRVPGACWDLSRDRLDFSSNTPGNAVDYWGCRLAGSIEI